MIQQFVSGATGVAVCLIVAWFCLTVKTKGPAAFAAKGLGLLALFGALISFLASPVLVTIAIFAVLITGSSKLYLRARRRQKEAENMKRYGYNPNRA